MFYPVRKDSYNICKWLKNIKSRIMFHNLLKLHKFKFPYLYMFYWYTPTFFIHSFIHFCSVSVSHCSGKISSFRRDLQNLKTHKPKIFALWPFTEKSLLVTGISWPGSVVKELGCGEFSYSPLALWPPWFPPVEDSPGPHFSGLGSLSIITDDILDARRVQPQIHTCCNGLLNPIKLS